jgi:hypothetical protein
MSDQRGGHLHVIVLHHDPRRIELVRDEQMPWIWSSFVLDSGVDIELHIQNASVVSFRGGGP